MAEQQRKLDKERAQIVLEAKNEANHIVASTKKQAEQLISEIRKERLNVGQQAGSLSEQDLQVKKGQFDKLRQNDSLEKIKSYKKLNLLKHWQRAMK